MQKFHEKLAKNKETERRNKTSIKKSGKKLRTIIEIHFVPKW